MVERKKHLRQIFVGSLLEVVVPGAAIAIGGLILSLFRDDAFADYTRYMSVVIFLVMFVVGAFRSILIVYSYSKKAKNSLQN